MAKLRLTAGLAGLSGRLGNILFRQLPGRVVLCRVPDFSRRRLSADQRQQTGRFAAAVRAALVLLADPVRKAALAAEAARTHRPLMAVAISAAFKTLP